MFPPDSYNSFKHVFQKSHQAWSFVGWVAQSVVVLGPSGPSCPGNVSLAVEGHTCGSAPESRAAAAVAATPPSGVDEAFESSVLDLSIAGWDKDLGFPIEPVTSCDVMGPRSAVALSA